MKRTKIKQLFLEQKEGDVLVYAWVRTNRAQAQFGFLNVNDGSSLANLQVVYDIKLANFEISVAQAELVIVFLYNFKVVFIGIFVALIRPIKYPYSFGSFS